MQGQVNAKDVYEIDRFGTNETRGVKITPEDEKKYYRHFDLVHAQHWQEEVVRLYEGPLLFVNSDVLVNIVCLHTHTGMCIE